MRCALPSVLLLAATASAAAPSTGLSLRWEVKERVASAGGELASRAVFTLTNRGPAALPERGWAIYFSSLHEPRPGTVHGGVVFEGVTGDFQRMMPGPAGRSLAVGE